MAKPKVVRKTKDQLKQEQIDELKEKLESMKKDKEAKLKSAKEQLVDMLFITRDKYLTATGTAEALRTLRFAIGDESYYSYSIHQANVLAFNMAELVQKMGDKALDLPYEKMDTLCEDFYEKHFDLAPGSDFEDDAYQLAFEMMKIDLCRNVGPSAEDMIEFMKRCDEDIEATEKKLAELNEE